ncbi:MAG: hypothetical protein ABIF82_05820 [Planctomycetota bacterium]
MQPTQELWDVTNVLIASDGTVKLADLGLARETGCTDSGVTQVGTPLEEAGLAKGEDVDR